MDGRLPPHRVGFGYDVHRTARSRPLILAGVRVPCEFGLLGHSDADVVLHALCDALLGAAGLGDIGELFPDSNPEFKDVDSTIFLDHVLRLLRRNGWSLVNVDIHIHAERPRLAPHKDAMRARLRELLGLPPDAVNVKAGTNEGLDAVGRGEAIACSAAALLERLE